VPVGRQGLYEGNSPDDIAIEGVKLTPGEFEPIGPGAVPMCVAVVTVVLSLLMFLGRWRRSSTDAASALPLEEAAQTAPKRWGLMLSASALTLVYAGVLQIGVVRYGYATVVYLLANFREQHGHHETHNLCRHASRETQGTDRAVVEAMGAPQFEYTAVNVKNKSHTITARVTIPDAGAQGVLLAHGSWFAGYALFVQDDRLVFVHNYLGLQEYRVDPALPCRVATARWPCIFIVPANTRGEPNCASMALWWARAGSHARFLR